MDVYLIDFILFLITVTFLQMIYNQNNKFDHQIVWHSLDQGNLQDLGTHDILTILDPVATESGSFNVESPTTRRR